MSTKGLIILAAVTALVVALAALAVKGDGADPRAAEGERLFPELYDRLNDVVVVEVASATDAARLEGSGNEWVLADKGGYPAKADTIKPLVVDLANAEVEQQMTSRPERYAKLGVADPDTPDSASRRVTLRDAGGAVLADVVVGNVVGTDECYVRRAGEATALKISKALRVQSAATNWIDREVLRLDRERVERVTVVHPDGELLEVVAQDEEGTQFDVLGVPPDRELSSPSAGNQLAMALSYVSLEDVAPAADFEWTDATVTEFQCRYGMRVTVFSQQVDGTWWTTYQAETGAEVGPSEVQAEVDELNGRLGDWAFAVSSYKAESMVERLGGLLMEPEPEPEPEEGTEEGADPTPVVPVPEGSEGSEPEVEEPASEEPVVNEPELPDEALPDQP